MWISACGIRQNGPEPAIAVKPRPCDRPQIKLEFPRTSAYNRNSWRFLLVEEIVKLQLTEQQIAEIKKQIGFELREIYLTKRSLNKLRVFRLRLSEEQQQTLEEQLGQKVKELTVTRSVATRIL